jgi:3-deoxy-manno-octulosonate cytidylyltransferase (CMP-KDO synthetase)
MSAVVIIPARYDSTRLPGKPLLARTGKPLIQHVAEAVAPAVRIDRVVVATDDDRVAAAVGAFGGDVVMTSKHCRSGTDRVAEAARRLKLSGDDIIVNVQGDEPEMPAAYVDQLVGILEASDVPMATLAAPLAAAEAADPNCVKVVCDLRGRALYFSRAVIPFDRDRASKTAYWLHLGIYAYRGWFLARLAELSETPAERAEKLEQLRVLEHGHAIAVGRAARRPGAGIDTPADYEAFVARFLAR